MPTTLHYSNRLEILADRLAHILSSSPLPPLSAETVVVPGKGMERWLWSRLAARLGIVAGIDFPFTSTLIDTIARRVVPLPLPHDPYDPEMLTWTIDGILATLPDSPVFAEPARFVAGDEQNLRRYQLARRIAETFDRYTVYRPDILLGWEQGGGGGWQGEIWRTIVNRFGETHRVHRLRHLAAAVTEGEGASLLPPRISLFGVGHLPPLYLDLFLSLSRFIDLRIFLLSPCREYWGDHRRKGREFPREEHGEGNDLLAALGTLGRDFLDRILDHAEQVEMLEEEGYEEPSGTTLLEGLQRDMLKGGVTPFPLDSSDRSVTLHLCHSPMREVELLHDQLLHLFESHHDLTPRDVLVLTPDIETYAPCVEAVFGTERGGGIPFGIAFHDPPSRRPYGSLLARMLTLPDGRFTPPEVLDILESPPVSERFGFTPSDMERMRSWIVSTGVVWGYDPKDRQEEGLPPYDEGCWRSGMDRLLWSWPLPPRGTILYEGVAPVEGIEGDAADLAGRFMAAVEELARLRRELTVPRTLSGWGEFLAGILSPFGPGPTDTTDYDGILATLSTLFRAEETSGCHAEVPFPVIRTWIMERLTGGGGRYHEGVVTVSPIRPMRAIPARVVVLLGMNDGSFPRTDPSPEFDLTIRDPRRGDCPLREEDRSTMLETILSARSRLIITCTGMSITDDSVIPPSVLVSELMDAVERRTGTLQGIVVRHPLHPFDPRCFMPGNEPPGYSPIDRDAAESLSRPAGSPPPFVPAPLAPLPADEIHLGDLLKFYRNPSRFFLSRRLGFTPRKVDRGFREERLDPDPLANHLLRSRIITLLREGMGEGECRRLVRAEGLLLPGRVGDHLFAEALADSLSLVRKIGELTGGGEPLAAEIELSVGTRRIIGKIPDISPDRLLRVHPSNFREHHLLSPWLELVVMSAAEPERTRVATVITLDRSAEILPPDDPLPILSELVTLYDQGCHSPLPFLPDPSFEVMLEGAVVSPPDDPAFDLCFRGTDPFDVTFRQTAERILSPLLASWRRA